MPRLPLVPQRTTVPDAFSSSPRARASDFGAGIGPAVAAFGQEVASLSRAIDARDARELAKAEAKAQADAEAAREQSDAQAVPDEEDDARMSRHLSLFDESAAAVVKTFEGDRLQARVREKLNTRRQRWQRRLMETEARRRLQRDLSDAQGLAESWTGRVAADPAQLDLAVTELLGDEAQDEAGLLAALGLRPEALSAWKERTLEQLLRGQLAGDPAVLLADLDAGRWQDALPESSLLALREDAGDRLARRETQALVERTQQGAGRTLALSAEIAEGKAGRAEIRQAEAEGSLSPDQAEVLRREAAVAEIAAQARQMASDELALSLTGGTGFDAANPQNRAAADAFYETAYSAAVREGTTESVQVQVVSAVARMGYFPKTLARDVTAMLQGSDENGQVRGAELYGRLRDSTPELLQGAIDLETRARGGVLGRWLKAGLDPADARRRTESELPRNGEAGISGLEKMGALQRELSSVFDGENTGHWVRPILEQLDRNYLDDLGKGLTPREGQAKLRRDAVKLLFRLSRLREELNRIGAQSANAPDQNSNGDQDVSSGMMLANDFKRAERPLFSVGAQTFNQVVAEAASIELQESRDVASDAVDSFGFELSSDFWREVARIAPELAATTGYAVVSLGSLESYLGKVTEETQDGRIRSVQIIRPFWGRTTIRQLQQEKGGEYTNLDGTYFDYRRGREQKQLLTGEHESGRKWPPLGPRGADIDANIKVAERSRNPFWFKKQVENKGPWDFKQQGKAYENFGNFHFGAVGAAMGFPDTILLNEAGIAQKKADTSKPEWGEPAFRYFPFFGDAPYGDDPRDQYWIKQGIDYYRNRENWHSLILLGP